MTYNFNPQQLHQLKEIFEDRGVVCAFRTFHWLNPDTTIPADDVVEFYYQFKTQYYHQYGYTTFNEDYF
jgi:hypothetical protein